MHKDNIIPFDYGDDMIRVIQGEDGEPWWIAKDVCKVLGLNDVTKAVQNLDDDEKLIRTLFSSGQQRATITINEAGLYTLLIRSNKPEAKTFRRWVTHEVLPSIRKTGQYRTGDDNGFFMDAKKAGNLYFPMAKLVEGADKYLEGKAALKALNYFTGMPVDDLLSELEDRKTKNHVGALDWGKNAIEDFLVEQCELSPSYRIQSTEAYTAFCNWCRNQGITRTMTQKKFGLLLGSGFERVKNGSVFYTGFRLKENRVVEPA